MIAGEPIITKRVVAIKKLGQGAMGQVQLAYVRGKNPSTRIVVAKTPLIIGDPVQDANLRHLLRRENDAALFLGDHPNLVKGHGTAVDEETEEKCGLMEFVSGKSIEEQLTANSGRGLEVTVVENVLRGTCAGLQHMHEVGLVHRDVKPGNIMLDESGIVKLLDFGLAAPFVDTVTNGLIVGSPAYSSPEQLRGHELDGRSDIFSLGVSLVEMLTGRHPFVKDEDVVATMCNILLKDVPEEIMAQIPERLRGIITRMLAKDVDERYDSCNDIIRALGGTVEEDEICDANRDAVDSNLDGAAEQPSAVPARPFLLGFRLYFHGIISYLADLPKLFIQVLKFFGTRIRAIER
ncbi:MAG: serine/threonine-protein kinase [Candidatus Margulisiibacteriota bacterium]